VLTVLVPVLMVAAGVGLGERTGPAPGVVVAAALVPAVGFAGLVLLVARRGPAPWPPLGAAFLWGATVSVLAALGLNDAAARAAPALVPTVVAPAVEEICKASALVVVALLWRRAFDGVRAGVLYGALAGLGFAATENVSYYTLAAVQGGPPGLVRALYLRGLLQGLNHAAFTATTGAAAGHALARRGPPVGRAAIALGGLALAVAAHALWNAVASQAITRILCNAPSPGAPCTPAPDPLDLVVTIPVLVAAFIGPLGAVLLALALRPRRAGADRPST
jgi:RsiW-degrading membrane proteinase PrsW (M82 family)